MKEKLPANGLSPHLTSAVQDFNKKSFTRSVRLPPTDFVVHFTFDFHKKCSTGFHLCRTTLIRGALESPDPGASNVGLIVEIGSLGADLITFQVAEWSLKNITGIIFNYLETRSFQKSPDWPQVARFRRLTHS